MSQIKPIPTPTDITADWLAQHLGWNVSGVSAKAVGTGQVGATYRFSLTDPDPDAAQKASLIGKFMSEDPVSRATGIAQLSYVREVKFYQNYGNTKPLPIPTARYAVVDEATHDFALLMDDFPSHRPGNQLTPATLEEAKLAMGAAASIHAAWWGDKGLDTHAWLNGSQAASGMNVDGLFEMLWPAFCARYGDQINDQIRATGEAYLGRINDWITQRPGPRCLTHGDFRPDNMLFLEGDPAHPIVIVDWQTAGVGNGATDIAYYLGTALTPEMRRTHEMSLINLWIDHLEKAGVPQADTQNLWDIYRRDALAGFLMGVLASMIVAQTPRGDAMFLAMCARAAAMVSDHRSFELI
ncbi:phosphotransferase family protein [Aquidulcibacter sp.]|uniref:phosphotransferase family protein n=1 Tax=Aquidulcibacter sp. TaxID=2052990 RepID=UPI003BA7B2DD